VPFVKDLGKKQLVTAQSLYKLEDGTFESLKTILGSL